MSDALKPQAHKTMVAAGALLGQWMDTATPTEMQIVETYLGAGGHLGVSMRYTAEAGVMVILFVDAPDRDVMPLARLSMPAAPLTTH